MRTKIPSVVSQVVKKAKKEPASQEGMVQVTGISSGSTLLNLACSDNPYRAFPLGKMVNLIGDSSSGKTILALTAFAEAAKKKKTANHLNIFDDAEAANEFNIRHLFGETVSKKVESPGMSEDGEPLHSETIQDFHSNVHRALKAKDPFIYILDSFDAVTSEEEIEKTEVNMKAREDGKETKGTYGMDKAKMASQILRMIIRKLKHTNSFLLIVSQTRDNNDPMSHQRKTRSGGRALKFYASHEIWTSIKQRIMGPKGRTIGVLVQAKVTKNKLTGKERTVEFPIYYDYGVDDLGSCIDFLVKEGFWKKKGISIKATGLNAIMKRGKLIHYIENNNLEKRLKEITSECWHKIEESLKLKRKPKYA